MRWRCILPAALALLAAAACAPPGDQPTSRRPPPVPRGLHVVSPEAAPGYVLYSPLSSGTTYLLDREARVVHTWESEYSPHSLYLLDDGSLLRPGRDPDPGHFLAGGRMGIVQRFDWDGQLLWEWKLSDQHRILHHDIEPLPGGNFLALGWESRSPAEARAVGRRPDLIGADGLWPEFLVEIEPLPPDDARIVWEWRVWDHLVQDLDPTLPHHGDPADHPHRIDVNAGSAPLAVNADQLAELRALGYVPEEPAGSEEGSHEESEWRRLDYLHINSVDWNPALDQIALTVPELAEIWILRRPASTEEAAGPAGDLLYRWGHPATYGRGEAQDQRLFYPHDAQWIPAGWEGAGHLTVFNNGANRLDGDYSSVDEFAPPLEPDGTYRLPPDDPWGPDDLVWSYTAESRESFFAGIMSGAHRLPNGNTFVTDGPGGRMFEVTAEGRVVWDFRNPWGGDAAEGGGRRYRYGVFRAEKLSPDHPGLAGRELTPLAPQPSPDQPPLPRSEADADAH